MNITTGKLIVGMGLPCSGKSSVIQRVAEICQSSFFLEPEESAWPDAIHKREHIGFITATTWFRAIRVPLLYEAESLKKAGQLAFVDSYYDKLVLNYMGKAGMEWLIPTNDLYYPIAKQIAELDYQYLPDADCVVTFHVSREKWNEMLKKRNRKSDQFCTLSETYAIQEYFISAAQSYCNASGAKHIVFDNKADQVNTAANDLIRVLRENKVILK